MRNLIYLLLIAGIAFLGYEYGRRRNVDAKGPPTVDDAKQSKGDDAQRGGASTLETLSLDSTGMQGVEIAAKEGAASSTDGRLRTISSESSEPAFASEAAERAANRLVEALDARDFSRIEVAPGLRDELPLGTTGRYALEVALALEQGPDDGSGQRNEELSKAAAGLLATSNHAALLDRMAGAFDLLTKKAMLGRAVAATGGKNHFLAGKGGGAACQAWLRASGQLEDGLRAVALSSLLDAMTRGNVPIWREGPSFALLRDAYEPLQKVLKALVFNPNGSWRSRFETVGRNVTLAGIASRCAREWDLPMSAGLLQRINGISNPKSLREGARLRIPTEKISVVVEKSTFSMKVYLGDVLLRLYEVGLGENGSTPETEFKVTELQADPQWTNPRTGVTFPARHPENLIGRFFIRLEDGVHQGFGIHGTKDQTSIGKNSSMGCIRLRELDIEDVFSYLPRSTKVVVRG